MVVFASIGHEKALFHPKGNDLDDLFVRIFFLADNTHLFSRSVNVYFKLVSRPIRMDTSNLKIDNIASCVDNTKHG